MPLQIPMSPLGDRKIIVTLGNNTLQLRTYFNSVSEYYCLDVLTELDEPIVLGITLKSPFNLFARQELTNSIGQLRMSANGDMISAELRQELTNTIGQLRMSANATPFGSLGQTAQLLWFAPGEFESLDFDEIGDVTTLPLTYDFDALFPPRRQPLT